MSGELVLPETWAQIMVIAVAVLPGFVYQVSRRRVHGPDPDEISLGTRLLRAIMASGMFAGAYAIALGPWMVDRFTPGAVIDQIQVLGVGFLVLVVAIPWLMARIGVYLTTSKWWVAGTQAVQRFINDRLQVRSQWDPTPSAWDFMFRDAGYGFVRILNADGRWIGGWFGKESFATSYPEPKELYIELGYVVDDDGTLTDAISAPGGLYVRCADAVLVDFIPVEEDNGDNDQNPGSGDDGERPTGQGSQRIQGALGAAVLGWVLGAIAFRQGSATARRAAQESAERHRCKQQPAEVSGR